MLEASHSIINDLSLGQMQEWIGCNVVLLIGAPLSGKSTQSKLLAQTLDRPCVSSGDLFRTEVATCIELGKQMTACIDNDELIPSELTVTFLTAKLSDSMYKNGVILHGYPRNRSHLQILDNILMNLDRSILTTIYLDVSKSKLDQRQSKQTRTDDGIQIFEHRYSIFQEETLPLIDELKKRDQLIRIICDSESPEEIHKNILTALLQRQEQNHSHLDSYEWLEVKLATKSIDKITVLNEFRQRALDENEKLGRRTGILRRVVYLRTANLRKYNEHIKIFEKLYGIEVIRVPSNLIKGSDDSNAILLLSEKIPNLVQLAVITERSNLYRPGTNLLSSLHHGVRAINQSTMMAIWIDAKTNEIFHEKFTYSTVGRIDLSRRRSMNRTDPLVFGWDDIFVVEANGMSYQELNEASIKHSSRDMVISAFIKQRIHYKELLNLKFNSPPKVKRTIDFSIDMADYVHKNITYNNSKVVEYGFRNLIFHVLNAGIFCRAANNRRQANYWSPGLNGGLPLTVKGDPIHQDTFLAHDFGHFAIPDLVFIGTDSILHRRAYIAWRMVSEATTMALADMLLVDALVKSGVEYDFDKRRIYPLFRDLHLTFDDSKTRIDNLKRVIHANYKYCLMGDDSFYVEMLSAGRDTPSLIEFKKKFCPFFVEDFRWTEHNYENMVNRCEEISRWWSDIEPIRKFVDSERIETIDDFLADMQQKNPEAITGSSIEFIDTIFEIIFDRKIRPILDLESPPLLEPSKRLFKAFIKWISAQLAITSKFHFLSESEEVRNKIIAHICTFTDRLMSLDDVAKIRLVFENYLHCLAEKNLISHDDEHTYAELYPLFDPFYVNYDKDITHYEDLSSISERIFSAEHYRQKQLVQTTRCIGRPLTLKERFYISAMLDMIEAGGGQTLDGTFVIRPGVMILSESPIIHRLGMVTFLLSGISIETSLEFVAHREAKVARLTSSKTNAMNLPLFRVQGTDTFKQRLFLANLITERMQFELISQPRSTWRENGNELFNMTSPGCKVTAICYTMTLEDFHQLFIGRMSPSGNEQEVIDVAQRMSTLLHARYPSFIHEPKYYTTCGNASKYQMSKSINTFCPTDNDAMQLITILAQSTLTKGADQLMKKFNINFGNDCQRLAEFRSRITYLSFLKSSSTDIHNAHEYLDKVVNQHGHFSVLDACQVVLKLPRITLDSYSKSVLNTFTIEQIEQGMLLFATMKQLRVAVLNSTPNDLHYEILAQIQSLIE
ncbi:unnamed protein product [Rotaria magnacalcarata]|uniref:Adenylate kinase n=3 Tax=Rotaria magnacalcarata TaxID=392030 RepID=A0A815A0D2_9BILA|nr:unnamed protein product [Rotaria magnacalcarata]